MPVQTEGEEMSWDASNYLTVGRLMEICKQNDYIIARYSNNRTIAVNCKISKLKRFSRLPLDMKTQIIGFVECSFDRYLTEKPPFTKGKGGE